MARVETSSVQRGAFDFLRLAAAAMVLVGHSYVLTGAPEQEPLTLLSRGRTGFGEIAVMIFFAISGFLVTRSWIADPHPLRFLLRRALRIIPALAAVVAFCVFILGPLVTTEPVPAYFAARETWTYLARMLVFPGQNGLPHVFDAVPFPNVVNGSLWSLRMEVGLYLVLAAIGACGLLRFRWFSALAVLAAFAGFLLTQSATVLAHVPFAHQVEVFFINAVPFFVGAWLAQLKLRQDYMVALSLALSFALCAAVGHDLFRSILVFMVPVVTLTAALWGRCDLSRWGDISYGYYLWAFPIQQLCVSWMPDLTPLRLALIAAAGTLVAATLSWHFIEEKALRLKPRRPAGATAS